MTEEKKPRQVHHKRAGAVGETGEHGDLGSNAVGWAPPVPSAADLDADAAEKAAAAATSTAPPADAPVVEVPAATDAKPAPNREEIKAQIAGSLALAGYSQEKAVEMAESAVAMAEAAKQEGIDAT